MTDAQVAVIVVLVAMFIPDALQWAADRKATRRSFERGARVVAEERRRTDEVYAEIDRLIEEQKA